MLIIWHNLDKKRKASISKRRYRTEQIIGILRETEVKLFQGLRVGQICRYLEITEQTYYRCRRVYRGMKLPQAKRLNKIQKENSRVKSAVADLTLDKLIFKEALAGNF